MTVLEFEKPIYELMEQLEKVEQLAVVLVDLMVEYLVELKDGWKGKLSVVV
jgi:hypothetical protein